jgi:predicted phosphohydrolase
MKVSNLQLLALLGVEVVVVPIHWPVVNTEQLVVSVSETLAREKNVKYCLFSHISSMVTPKADNITTNNTSVVFFSLHLLNPLRSSVPLHINSTVKSSLTELTLLELWT